MCRIVLTSAQRRLLPDTAAEKYRETKRLLRVGYRGMTQAHVDWCHSAIDILLSDEPIPSPGMDLGKLVPGTAEEKAEPQPEGPAEDSEEYLTGQDLVFEADPTEPPYQRFWVGTVVRSIRAREKPDQEEPDAVDEGTGERWLRIWWRSAAVEYGTYKRAYIPNTLYKDEVWIAASDAICPVFGNLTSKDHFSKRKATERKQRYATRTLMLCCPTKTMNPRFGRVKRPRS